MNWLVLGLMAIAAALMLKIAPPVYAQGQNCDSSYPDFCIAPPPPDLDCGDMTQKNFTVRQPDPHRFDGDKDGIGCEA
jgi:Excalibur calcium-binding domain